MEDEEKEEIEDGEIMDEDVKDEDVKDLKDEELVTREEVKRKVVEVREDERKVAEMSGVRKVESNEEVLERIRKSDRKRMKVWKRMSRH